MPAPVRQPHSAPRSPRKDDVIQIRASAETKAILSRAAALRGQKLSEFMLDSARRQAEDALLDQRIFALDAKTYDAFLALLNAPTKSNARLVELMSRKAPWES
ncbi:MAG: antitoxin [Massilia sp.]|nr:antitoxin [Massilia sp.]